MTEESAESDGYEVPPRLRKFAENLWLDPSEIVGVRSYNDQGSYNRMVEIYLRNGESHKVATAHGSGSQLVSVGDAKRDEWLSKFVGDLIDEPRLRPELPARPDAAVAAGGEVDG